MGAPVTGSTGLVGRFGSGVVGGFGGGTVDTAPKCRHCV